MADETASPNGADLVFTVGPTARGVLPALAGALSRVPRRPVLRGLTAEYPPVRTSGSSGLDVFDLAAVPDIREAVAWCRAQSARSETDCRWRAPIAGQNLEPAQVLWLYQYQKEHGGCDRLWDDLAAGKPTAIHVVCCLGDGASRLLPESIERIAERSRDGGGNVWVHVHVVLPEMPRGYSPRGGRVADDAAEVLRRIMALHAQPPSINVAWWLLGGPSRKPLRSLAETCCLVARLLEGTPPDPLSAWCCEYAEQSDRQGTGTSVFGSYRCGSRASLPTHVDATGWPDGFPDTRVPAHRRDLLPRHAFVWNAPGEWLADLKARDPRWDTSGPHDSALSGWATCRAWLAIDAEDLWWWHPDADRLAAEGRTKETVVPRHPADG